MASILKAAYTTERTKILYSSLAKCCSIWNYDNYTDLFRLRNVGRHHLNFLLFEKTS